ncbi:MAG TPA: hypothetical protein VMH24_07535 [Candidatus Sulfotelmatobacter sp.]|nr:hypothetical protein [Candidatus Sulfotelmatobacter sp.]
MPRVTRPRLARLIPCLLVAALVLAACGTPDRALATPQDNFGLVQTMAQHGLTVVSQISGDPGCSEPGVVANAVHWRVMAATDKTARDVYIFRFLDHAAFVTGGPEVDTCQAEFTASTTRAGGPVTRLDISPWRVFGDGWSADLQASLSAAMTAAAGNGGLQPPGEDQ